MGCNGSFRQSLNRTGNGTRKKMGSTAWHSHCNLCGDLYFSIVQSRSQKFTRTGAWKANRRNLPILYKKIFTSVTWVFNCKLSSLWVVHTAKHHGPFPSWFIQTELERARNQEKNGLYYFMFNIHTATYVQLKWDLYFGIVSVLVPNNGSFRRSLSGTRTKMGYTILCLALLVPVLVPFPQFVWLDH